MFSQKSNANFTGLSLALGLIVAGALIGHGVQNVKRADRFVTVKGLVEREVVADLAVWSIPTKVAGNDLAAAQRDLEASLQKITAFLTANGVAAEEIEIRPWRVFDRKTAEYGEARMDQYRFILQTTVGVRSPNVEQIRKISQMTSELVKSGVTLSDDTSSCVVGPTFLYTKLNEVKPQMLAEATKNARSSAEQFAADSGSAVGQIRQANQGVFSITARDENDQSGGCGISDPNKKIRVVTTVDYYLEG